MDSSTPTEQHQRAGPLERLKTWVYCHPATGWWLACIGVVNILLNIIGIFAGH